MSAEPYQILTSNTISHLGALAPPGIEGAGIIVLGLVLGSFATALAHRAAGGQSWFSLGAHKRSACPSCGHALGLADLMPVFSWLFLRGRCRHCAAPISKLYPLTEGVVLLLVGALYLAHGLGNTVPALCAIFAVPFLWALTIVDLREKLLPNSLLIGLAALGGLRLASLSWGGQPLVMLIEYGGGAFIYGGLAMILAVMMTKLMKKQAMGLGDVKFFALAGLWLGLSQLSHFMMLAGVLGVVLGLIWMKIRGEQAFPFGPALIASFYILLLLPTF